MTEAVGDAEHTNAKRTPCPHHGAFFRGAGYHPRKLPFRKQSPRLGAQRSTQTPRFQGELIQQKFLSWTGSGMFDACAHSQAEGMKALFSILVDTAATQLVETKCARHNLFALQINPTKLAERGPTRGFMHANSP